ncbi:MAG: hypothetical protein ACKPKO_22960, partial [Candidatus Fonsibacter sp.]
DFRAKSESKMTDDHGGVVVKMMMRFVVFGSEDVVVAVSRPVGDELRVSSCVMGARVCTRCSDLGAA